jgi:hypothetical protein
VLRKQEILFHGQIEGNAGNFSTFDPAPGPDKYIIEVDGFEPSTPFKISEHLMERISSRLAYQFFIDCRGGFNSHLSPANVTGGGSSRDGGGSCLEATFEGLLYASNPALFDRWFEELRGLGSRSAKHPPIGLVPIIPPPDVTGQPAPANLTDATESSWQRTPDLIKLLLWHGEFAYANRAYSGRTGGYEERADGYEGWVRRFGYDDQHLQSFDYQNMLDQIAAVHGFYHAFLEPFLSEEIHQSYRRACLENWERYDRQKEVRYWVKSYKWIDAGRLEFSEQGNALGQGLLRNLLMYLGEQQEADGQASRFLKYAQQCAEDIVANWDFNNPVHTWRMRNGEHIAPQSLAMFILLGPPEMTHGAKEKLAAWRDYIVKRTNNLWHYRTHNDTEWAHTQSKEVGTVGGLGGAMFVAAEALGDSVLREIGWSQVNFVFGCNPAGGHLGNKSELRVRMEGYWEGVENGWPASRIYGTGSLMAVRGTLDGSPTDGAFPYNPDEAALYDRPGIYGTEGWSITNRAWLSTDAFSTIGSHRVRVLDPLTGNPIDKANSGSTVRIELRAALSQSWGNVDSGWVMVQWGQKPSQRLTVIESKPDSGLFCCDYIVPNIQDEITFSYGYLCFKKTAKLTVI